MATMLSRKPSASHSASRYSGWLWVAVCVLAACGDLDPTSVDVAGTEKKKTPMPTPTSSVTNPFAGISLFAEPTGFALSTAESWRATRPADAALMEKIGRTAQAVWFNGWQTDVGGAAAKYVGAAAAAGAMPVLVAYNIPQRDCGSYSAGGSSSGGRVRLPPGQ